MRYKYAKVISMEWCYLIAWQCHISPQGSQLLQVRSFSSLIPGYDWHEAPTNLPEVNRGRRFYCCLVMIGSVEPDVEFGDLADAYLAFRKARFEQGKTMKTATAIRCTNMRHTYRGVSWSFHFNSNRWLVGGLEREFYFSIYCILYINTCVWIRVCIYIYIVFTYYITYHITYYFMII